MPEDPFASQFLELFKGIFEFYRDMSSPLVDAFDDTKALTRPVETLNNAVWLVGHMSWVTDSLLAEIPHARSFRNREWDGFFAIGQPRLPAGEYPPFNEVKGKFKEILVAIEALLKTLTPQDLSKDCAGRTDWFPTPMDGMIHFVRDCNYHLGQLSFLLKMV